MAESKFTPERVKLLLKGAADGVPERTLAASVGISFDTLKDWFHSEDPDKVAFTSEFRAARAGKHIELHNDVQNTDDWRAKTWILERTNDDYRVEGHGAFGLRPSDMAQPLNEKQIEHRFIQTLAFPTQATQKVIREAAKRGNPTFWALIEEIVKTRPLLAEGTEAPEPSELLELAPRVHTTTPELTARIAAFLDVLDAHPRVALGGGPECGKTEVFAAACSDRKVVHTDHFITGQHGEWETEARRAAEACMGESTFLIEGVRVAGCIRAGLTVDCLVWLRTPLQILTKGQQTQTKGRETDLKKLRAERPDLKVVVI